MFVSTITIGKCVTEHRGGRSETCQLALGKCLTLLGIECGWYAVLRAR
jgi:hypothetical protein